MDIYQKVRNQTLNLCKNLKTEDLCIQTMPDVSPAKWHLAHTSWFFETFILSKEYPKYKPVHPQYNYLFNSYYNQIGKQYPRFQRGFLSRPTVEEILEYRRLIDKRMKQLISRSGKASKWNALIELGLQHEQQHQELILTDIKHVFSQNPLKPVYKVQAKPVRFKTSKAEWIAFNEQDFRVGHEGNAFCFDNETPKHKVHLISFEFSDRLVTNEEYMQFIEDGGYRRTELWLSQGWEFLQNEKWQAPLYWKKEGANWYSMTLNGWKKINRAEPVCHVSYFEADAYANWAQARLPTEAEWELAASDETIKGNFVENKNFHPAGLNGAGWQKKAKIKQMFGDVWEWTRSPYAPYPGFSPPKEAIGEYNGKFMCSQMVLKGGSCATPKSHIRPTYRNFFYPKDRWQFTGIRLARDL